METFDPQVAARVWQRVTQQNDPLSFVQPPPPVAAGLARMVQQAWQCAFAYQFLFQRVSGSDSRLLKGLYEQKQGQAVCLKGLCAVTGESCPTPPRPDFQKQSVKAALHRCYHLELQTLQDYEAHTSDPRQGQIYTQLVRQQRKLCLQVLELLGRLSPSK